ncbi:MAG: ABC transporter permease, partial [Rhodothermales bacterium]
MFRNYLTTALRNLRKEKTFTFINTFGLALGVACVLLITLFVRHEWSFDAFHDKSDRLYRAWGKEDWGEGREFFYTVTPVVLAPTLEETIPEVESTVRVRDLNALVGPEKNRFTESIRMVDTTFFDVFDFELLEGGQVFANPNSVVVTPRIARKYFGTTPAIGQSLSIEIDGEPQDFLVTGIVREPRAESSIRFDLLIPFTKAHDFMGPQAMTSWFNVMVETYVLLQDGAAGVEAKLPAMIRQVLGDEADRSGYRLGLQPITDIHLNTEYPAGIEPISTPVFSYMLGAVALLVLIVGSINFVTLSIGQSVRRAGEVG